MVLGEVWEEFEGIGEGSVGEGSVGEGSDGRECFRLALD